MEIDLEIYDRACFLLGLCSCNNMPLILEKEEKVAEIVSFIQNIQEFIKGYNITSIISYLESIRVKYELRKYIGLILVKEFSVNPFDIYETSDKDKTFLMDTFFKDTFEYAPYTSNTKLLKIFGIIYSNTFARNVFSLLLPNMLNYFKANAMQLRDFFDFFLKNPSDMCLWTVCQVPEYFAKADSTSFCSMMFDYAASENPLVLSATALITKRVLYDYKLDIDLEDVISRVVCKLKEYFNESEYIVFSSNSTSLVYCLLRFESGFENLRGLFNLMIDSNKNVRNHLVREIESICAKTEECNCLDMDLTRQICQNANAESECDTIGYLDMIFEREINSGRIGHSWLCMNGFLNKNKDCDLAKLFNSSFDVIFNGFENNLPMVYNDILAASSEDSIGFKILFSYWDNRKAEFDSVDWGHGLTDANVLIVAKKIIVSFFNAEFVVKWFIRILENKKTEQDNALYGVFEFWVCRNYPVIVSREIKNYFKEKGCDNEILRKIAEKNNTMMRKQEEILCMSDFAPNHSRTIKFQIEKEKVLKIAMKKAEGTSAFLKLAAKVPIKYGARFATIQKDAAKYVVHESEYMVNQFIIEPPVLFEEDPLFFNYCYNVAFKGNET